MLRQVHDTCPVAFARPRKGKRVTLTLIESPVPAGFPSPGDNRKGTSKNSLKIVQEL